MKSNTERHTGMDTAPALSYVGKLGRLVCRIAMGAPPVPPDCPFFRRSDAGGSFQRSSC